MSKRSADALHDDWLDAALAAEGREHRDAYVPDDGFTARVAAALPPPDAAPAWRRPALVALWAVAGVGAAMALPGMLTDIAREVYRIVGAQPVAVSELVAGIALLGSLALGGAAWALREE